MQTAGENEKQRNRMEQERAKEGGIQKKITMEYGLIVGRSKYKNVHTNNEENIIHAYTPKHTHRHTNPHRREITQEICLTDKSYTTYTEFKTVTMKPFAEYLLSRKQVLCGS